ncbi:hypothetical protein [Arenimonas terrae]|jgi:hypothetical protein|uniref:Toxin co-regulated pilus biosynthesis protein Q C-terminal domain-containing protein n=1 Tax=Arenimonas terrae TaxID=2546226 RepID=A0A5C4RSR0_9GAMM|nr:hypothetical protein [Arenimonas terrae]TNJ33964.1 hypothetical protein E1B00_11595 [Arenimonas terrae]
MNTALKIMASAVCLAAAAAGGYGLSRLQTPAAAAAEADNGLAAQLAEQALRQQALEEKLDRLVADIQGRRASASERSREQDGAASRQTLSERIAASRIASEALQSSLENRVANEAVSPAWALATTRQIEESLSAEHLQEVGATPPLQSSIECRSSICRIEMVYDNPGSIGEAALMLGMAINEDLPFTRSFQVSLPDGSTQIVVYATRKQI